MTYLANHNPVINVKDNPYNAKGDGVTDDTAAIQAAITAAVSTISGSAFGPAHFGQTVLIPAGVYKITSTLNVPDVDGLRIEGTGGLAQLNWFGNNSTPLLSIIGGHRCQFKNLTITANTTLTQAIYISEPSVASDWIGSHCLFENVYVAGTTVETCAVIDIDGAAGNIDFMHFVNCRFESYSNDGIQITDSQAYGIHFSDCVVVGAINTSTNAANHIANGSTTLFFTSNLLLAKDIGKTIEIAGAGAGGTTLRTTIVSILSSTSATLHDANSSGSDVTNATITYGAQCGIRYTGGQSNFYGGTIENHLLADVFVFATNGSGAILFDGVDFEASRKLLLTGGPATGVVKFIRFSSCRFAGDAVETWDTAAIEVLIGGNVLFDHCQIGDVELDRNIKITYLGASPNNVSGLHFRDCIFGTVFTPTTICSAGSALPKFDNCVIANSTTTALLGEGQTPVTLANGLNSNVSTSWNPTIRITGPTAPFSIDGFIAPPVIVGQTINVINTTTQPLTFVHEGLSSANANRIDCQSSGAGATTIPAKRTATLSYDITSSRWILQSLGLNRPVHLNVKDFGAFGDNGTDDTAAIQAAFNAKDALGGGTVFFPFGRYVVSSQINIGTKQCLIKGDGWTCSNIGPVNNAVWSNSTNVTGSVLVCSSTGGLLFDGNEVNFSKYQDFALVGPGSSSGTTGLTLSDSGGGASVGQVDNVFVANFSIGILIENMEDTVLHHPVVWGNVTGLKLHRNASIVYNDDIRVYDLNADQNTVGMLATGGAGLKFVGGLVQSNTSLGMNFAPEAQVGSTSQGVVVENIWFENNTTAAIQFDTTNNPIEDVSIDNCRISVTGLAFAGSNTLSLHLRTGNHFLGTGTLTIPSNVSGWSDVDDLVAICSSDAFYFRGRNTGVNEDKDFTSTNSAQQLAAEPNVPASAIAELTINVTATNGTDSASWRDIPLTVVTDGSANATYLGMSGGIIGPSAFTAGAVGWIINITTAGSSPHVPIIFVQAVSGVHWRIRVRGDSHS